MREFRLVCAFSLLTSYVLAAKEHPVPPMPDHIEIGRHTFVDMGPPLDFYTLYFVEASHGGTLIRRLSVTPPGVICFEPAKVGLDSATIQEPVSSLLNGRNPCEISQKVLKEELKRRKKGLVFSGAEVLLRIPCGEKVRILQAEILDRDVFDAAPNTPRNTSWTMALLERLDRAIGGPGEMDRPILALPEKDPAPQQEFNAPVIDDLKAGKYDGFFPGATDKLSDLYRQSQITISPPTMRLLSVTPVAPLVSPLPAFPPLARLARIEGVVSVRIDVDENGIVGEIAVEGGHPLLRKAVEDSVKKWTFAASTRHQQVEAKFEFALNCNSKDK